jgi:hypothetical protein
MFTSGFSWASTAPVLSASRRPVTGTAFGVAPSAWPSALNRLDSITQTTSHSEVLRPPDGMACVGEVTVPVLETADQVEAPEPVEKPAAQRPVEDAIRLARSSNA